MKELEQITRLWEAAEAAGESAVLATVVKTRGSSYRLPGARLLLTASGKRAGSVSGGCLEDDLIKKAWWLTENGPVIRQYDTTPEDDSAPAFGLGCSGVIHILLERLTPGNAHALSVISRVRETRQPAVLAHKAGADEEVFLEVIAPPIRLLVFGAGDDAVPVVELAKYLGWRVCVYDGRAHYARRERFPSADEVSVFVEDGYVMADPWTVAVLMTHSYSQDLNALRAFSTSPLRYLGILGPRKRTAQMLADAGLTEKDLAPQVHSPMGLDIGADGPEQVALSVIAEIQAAMNGRRGGLLRERQGSIHSPGSLDTSKEAWVRSIACA